MTCPICGSSNLGHCPDFVRCIQCGVVRTSYPYDPKMYGEDYAENYLKYSRLTINTPLNLFRLGLVSRYLGFEGSILDIGCCIGEFIRFAEKYYPCSGFEPNPTAFRWACERVHSPIFNSLNGQVAPVDAVTMFDVVEHLESPEIFLSVINYSYLKKSGIVCITTPSVDSFPITVPIQLEAFQKWKHFKPKEHLFLYTKESLTILLGKTGFKVVHWGTEESDIRPGNPNGDIMTCVARKAT